MVYVCGQQVDSKSLLLCLGAIIHPCSNLAIIRSKEVVYIFPSNGQYIFPPGSTLELKHDV